jgi:glycosyltransferase involved in cell wall biosynthesis
LQFRYQIDKYAPDLVHGFGTESVYGLVASEQNMPSIVFIQGILSELLPFTNRFSPLHRAILLHFERRTLRKATHLIAETSFGANWAKSINHKARVTIIPHAVNPLFLAATPAYSEHTCLCIGTIHNIKAVDIAIRALSLTSSKKLNLSIIGGGPLLRDMKQLSQDLGIEDRVKFLGVLSVEQVVQEMERAQMLSILSRMDTSPNVLTEAHAAGLPVIGTRVGGIPDMIEHEKDGFLVDTEDYKSVAHYMDVLSSDLNLVKHLGASGRNKVQRLNNPERIGQAHIQAYQKLLYSSL